MLTRLAEVTSMLDFFKYRRTIGLYHKRPSLITPFVQEMAYLSHWCIIDANAATAFED